MTYEFKTTPYPHQLRAFEASRDAPAFALLMEQRTGKTKVLLDTAAYLFERGQVDALVVVAPNGVHVNWVADEVPAHLPDRVARRCVVWRAGRAGTKSFARELEELVVGPHLAVLSLNVDALLTERCQIYLRLFLRARRCLAVADESDLFLMTPGAKRSKLTTLLGKRCAYRRIATGTAVERGPLDLYGQFNFLDPAVLGFSSHYAFKHRYAEWEQKFAGADGHRYETLRGYRNLDELSARVAPVTFFFRRDEWHDPPRKVYGKRYFELAPEQRRVYDELRTTFVAELTGGETFSAPQVLVRLLRLQQVASGFTPDVERWTDRPCQACGGSGAVAGEVCGECCGYGQQFERAAGKELVLAEKNPRLAALLAELAAAPGRAVIWARFQRDVDLVRAALPPGEVVEYHGRVSEADREAARAAFKRPDGPRYLLGNPRAGGRGLDFSAAETVVYYSHDFGLRVRQQSEDRVINLSDRRVKGFVDLVATDTVDEKIVAALLAKRELATLVNSADPAAVLR